MKQKLINKQSFKKSDGKCKLCGEDNYAALNVHRLNPGENGGKYQIYNCTTLCASCHAKVHAGLITIDKYYLCSDGTDKLRIIRNGKEEFI